MPRVAIVTGGGTGIGAAAARLLAANGLGVVVVGRRREPLDGVCAELGHAAVAVAADLGEPAAPGFVVEQALAAFGRVDVVVNNAAVIRNGPLDSFTRDEFDRHYAVNVAGPFFLVAAALPSLRASEDAAVVNVSSSVGSMVKPGSMLYGSSKAALEYLTRAWAYELAEDGIRVNCIADPRDVLRRSRGDARRPRTQDPTTADGECRRPRRVGVVPRRAGVALDDGQCDPRRRRPGSRAARERRRMRGSSGAVRG